MELGLGRVKSPRCKTDTLGTRRSPVGLQLCCRTREAHSAPELAQVGISPRGGNELQPSTDGLGDAGAASTQRLFKDG